MELLENLSSSGLGCPVFERPDGQAEIQIEGAAHHERRSTPVVTASLGSRWSHPQITTSILNVVPRRPSRIDLNQRALAQVRHSRNRVLQAETGVLQKGICRLEKSLAWEFVIAGPREVFYGRIAPVIMAFQPS